MTARYVCIHGHFYQPPRENPWLEAIEVQDSAYPFHDWNERITAEAYGPNATSRILDDAGRIERIVNNYARISFNFGPTLLAWMQAKAPATYAAILQADRDSRRRFAGHGSAMAQVYNHLIMPLANRRDKETQVRWGLQDFTSRFGRDPEGMWLAETAVDLETLELLAEYGVKFTLLAPHQARRFRNLGEAAWTDVGGGRVDPTRAYLVRLPSGRSISVFFYDGPVSQAVAFEGLLTRGEHLAGRLLSAFRDERTWPQLVHIATDGETYGHHHRYGDMALAYALQTIDARDDVALTNYGAFLADHPPTCEAEIFEDTSWSCAHGVDRWRLNCGCNTGMHPGWNQRWRAPLREALDWLRDRIAGPYERAGGELFHDPWGARNEYIAVVLDRGERSLQRFLEAQRTRPLSQDELVRALKLLELQRHAMLMYTSCGWFFDEISGIETVQVIQYAARVIQLARELFDDDLEPGFTRVLARAESNVAANGTGRDIYERAAKPAMTDLYKVGAHYAMTSLYEDYAECARVYCYSVERQAYESLAVGKAKVALGQARITSLVTRESCPLSFGVLHFGDHNLLAGVRAFRDDAAYAQMRDDVRASFTHADFPETIRKLDAHFGPLTYTLKSLFHDEQRRILDLLLQQTYVEAETAYRQIYEHHTPLMRFLTDLGVPLPRSLRTAGEFILNADLRRQFTLADPDYDDVRRLLDEAKVWRLELDCAGLAFTLQGTFEALAAAAAAAPSRANLERLEHMAAMARVLPFDVSLWEAQNVFYHMLQTLYPQRGAEAGPEAARWVESFRHLGDLLRVKVP